MKAQGMGPFVVPQGFGQFTLFLVGETPVGENLGIFRIQVDSLVVIHDRPVDVALLPVDISPVAEGFGKIGIEADGLIVIFNGPV